MSKNRDDINPYISIIVPTYNESQNINELLNRVHDALHNIEHEIIVVDDDSPDMTWKIVEDRIKIDSKVRIIRRKNDRGLSRAVVAGFNAAKGNLLGVIDADLQHDERILPEMIKKTDTASIVIGSRYVKGGGVGDWQFSRRIKSWLATKIAALILNIAVNDPMAGFFVINKETYQKIRNKINPQGFKILLEILYHSNAEAVEVPYHFRSRSSGESKLTSKVVWEYLKQVISLRRNKPIPERFVKYCIVGSSGVIIDMIIFSFTFELLLLPASFSGVISSQIAIFSNFIFNDLWTFSGRQGEKLISRFIKYEVTCFVGVIIKFCLILFMVNILNINPYSANGFGIVMVIFTNYIFSKLWVWKNHQPMP